MSHEQARESPAAFLVIFNGCVNDIVISIASGGGPHHSLGFVNLEVLNGKDCYDAIVFVNTHKVPVKTLTKNGHIEMSVLWQRQHGQDLKD